jgi:four helix bundle protein
MAGIARFEDLVAWQKARQLAAEIHRACEAGRIARDFALVDQVRRAAISVASNIAEGFERKGPGSFAQFLGYAGGSCAELRARLYLASDVGWLSTADFRRLMLLANQVAQLLGAFHASQLRRR